MRKTKLPKVAIVYTASVPWVIPCLDGIRRYAREHGGWHLFSSPPTLLGTEESSLSLRSMQGWNGDAIITASNNESDLRIARRMGIPIVNLAGGVPQSCGVPRVMVDHFQAGRLAADYLLSRGLEHLAYFGTKGVWYSEQRFLGFRERALESRIRCSVLLRSAREESTMNWTQRIAGPAKWMASLPRPSGVFAVHDYRAQLLIEACQETGMRIPEDVAIIGMDNDETICEHSVPTLTSISRNSELIGWEAAALLHRMMEGDMSQVDDLLIAPEGVIERQSTDALYFMDPLVREVIDFMKQNLKNSFNIAMIAESVGVSKRTLEMRFRSSTDSSPHEYASTLRVHHAQRLLQKPGKRTMKQIAEECGFGTTPTFYASFQRVAGKTPAAFRRDAQGKR